MSFKDTLDQALWGYDESGELVRPEEAPPTAQVTDDQFEAFAAMMAFNPDQRRGPDGRWVKMGGGTAAPDPFVGALSGRDAWNTAPRSSGRAEQAAATYAGDSYREINEWMRSTTKQDRYGDPLYEYTGMREDIRALRQGIANSPLAQDTQVWRGVGSLGRMLPGIVTSDSLEGLEWEDRAFVSTTVNESVLGRFAAPQFYDSARLRVLLPKGTGAVREGEWDYEAELILGPGTRFRVVKDNGLVDNVRQLDVEVIPGE